MTTYLWQGPLTTHQDQVLAPGARVELPPADPITKSWLELGYLKPAPTTPKKKEA